MFKHLFYAILISTLLISGLRAEEQSSASALRLAAMFNTGMILQQKTTVPVWGWAAANSTVSLKFAGQKHETQADADGAWMIKLDAMDANAVGSTLKVTSDAGSISIDDVLIGEIWICAGQSNMNAGGPNRDTGYYPHYVSPENADAIAPVRLLRYGWGASLEPLTDNTPGTSTNGSWRNLTVAQVAKSTNTPEQFARILRDQLQVPIGILHVSVSGTNQAAWMHRETLEAFPAKGYANFYESFLEQAKAKIAKGKGIKTWEAFEAAYASWLAKPKGRSPASSAFVNFPTALYNTRIHPLAPFAVTGAIWHQGEGGPGGPYGERLVKMAQQWRQHFGQDFYFIYGTLSRTSGDCPPLIPEVDYFYRSATNRSIQSAIKHFGDDNKAEMVDFYDLGDTDTHWLNKNASGRRMALAALELAYGKKQIAYSGPRKTNIDINGPNATVSFTHVGAGISYKASLDGISGIVVKSAKGNFVWATVAVTGKDNISISHPDGEDIASIGYAMNRNPHETLFNSEGLPATPFEHNIGRIPYNPTGPRLITFEGEKKGRGKFSLAHVRENGICFQMVPVRGTNKELAITAKIMLPKAWNDDVEVLIKGETAPFELADGKHGKELHLSVLQDGAWIVVCKKGHAAEFVGIKRY